MKQMLLFLVEAVLCSAVSASALFTVDVQKSLYEAQLHGDVELVCEFSPVKSPSDLTVIWSRVSPKPEVNVIRRDRGKDEQNYTSGEFLQRARLDEEQLKQHRAVLQLQRLRIQDSGTYQCIVEGDEVDYKQTTLSVTARYSPIEKSILKSDSGEELELRCESQGFPSAHVSWSDGENSNLTQTSSSSSRASDLILVSSRLRVKSAMERKYTCSFLTAGGETEQTASFSIPDDIPRSSPWFLWTMALIRGEETSQRNVTLILNSSSESAEVNTHSSSISRKSHDHEQIIRVSSREG
ncbi:hypothetical protein DNTS_033273 [Danionella cerebrum]|uniref:Ig-like domain-containing protein n=1 Tax=Danionella cerebrum TaxID=2873325 RepID=A0A553RJM7_9TELE|nr:hypothetical protein DNTS_033273 [Danionella translucida]